MEQIEKYLKFLRELHQSLQLTDRVAVTNLCTKHKISVVCSLILKENGIIKETSGKLNRASRYEWTSSIIPNIKMAEELMKKTNQRVCETSKAYSDKANEEKTTKPTKKIRPTKYAPRVKKSEVRAKKAFSFFWGLIKFNW